MSRIHLNYEEARQCAQKLAALSAECEDIRRNLLSVCGAVSESWSGAAAESYYRLLQLRIGEVDRMRQEADQLAVEIKSTADRFEAAERQLKAEMAQGATSLGSQSGFSHSGGRGF